MGPLDVTPLRIGDIVRLNSGSHDLTIVEIATRPTSEGVMGHVVVSWRDDSGLVKESTLPMPCVYRVASARA